MMEAPAPEPDAAAAAPDAEGQGAASTDTPTSPPPEGYGEDDEGRPTHLFERALPAEALAGDVAPPSAEAPGIEIDVEEADLEGDPVEDDELLPDNEEPRHAGPPPMPSSPALATDVPSIPSKEFDEARERAPNDRPARNGRSASGSLVAINILIRLEKDWGITIDPDDVTMEIAKDINALLLEEKKWITDDARMRDVIAVLLPKFNATSYPPDGAWSKWPDDKLWPKFLEEVRKRSTSVGKSLMSTCADYKSKKREMQRRQHS